MTNVLSSGCHCGSGAANKLMEILELTRKAVCNAVLFCVSNAVLELMSHGDDYYCEVRKGTGAV